MRLNGWVQWILFQIGTPLYTKCPEIFAVFSSSLIPACAFCFCVPQMFRLLVLTSLWPARRSHFQIYRWQLPLVLLITPLDESFHKWIMGWWSSSGLAHDLSEANRCYTTYLGMKDVILGCVCVVKTSASVFYKGIGKSSGTDGDFLLHLTQKPLVRLRLLFIFLVRNSPSCRIRPPCAWW